ncbi:MAG: transcriptional regulator [Acidimicrobiales bacterium]
MREEDEWAQPDGYGLQLGRRLRAIRRQKGLSLQDVEGQSESEFKASALGAYERGERAISVPRLQRLARFYHVPVDQLLPIEPPAPEVEPSRQGSSARRRPPTGTITIDLGQARELSSPEGVMLNHYLEMIQVERQDFNGRMLTIRRDDIRALACIFHTDGDGIRPLLDEKGLLYQP